MHAPLHAPLRLARQVEVRSSSRGCLVASLISFRAAGSVPRRALRSSTLGSPGIENIAWKLCSAALALLAFLGLLASVDAVWTLLGSGIASRAPFLL